MELFNHIENMKSKHSPIPLHWDRRALFVANLPNRSRYSSLCDLVSDPYSTLPGLHPRSGFLLSQNSASRNEANINISLEKKLRKLFGRFGTVHQVALGLDECSRCRGFATVTMATSKAALVAHSAMNQALCMGLSGAFTSEWTDGSSWMDPAWMQRPLVVRADYIQYNF